MRHSFRQIAFLGVWVLGAIPAPAEAQPVLRDGRLASVHIMAYDTRGKRLDAPIVTIFESNGQKNLAGRFRSGLGNQIPYGVYRLETYLTAYSSETRYVRVYQPNVTVVVGLTLGGELPEVPPTLRGRVIGKTEIPPNSFVRLVGVYSSASMEAAIGGDGQFELGGITFGRFLLLIVSESGTLASKTVDLPYASPILEIELPSRE